MDFTVYHGGTTTNFIPPVFVARDFRVAKSYADDRRGEVYAMTFTSNNMGTSRDIERAAKELGIYSDDISTHEYVSPQIMIEATQVIEALSKQGFDSVSFLDFAMDSDFDMFEVICIFDLSTLGEPTQVDN